MWSFLIELWLGQNLYRWVLEHRILFDLTIRLNALLLKHFIDMQYRNNARFLLLPDYALGFRYQRFVSWLCHLLCDLSVCLPWTNEWLNRPYIIKVHFWSVTCLVHLFFLIRTLACSLKIVKGLLDFLVTCHLLLGCPWSKTSLIICVVKAVWFCPQSCLVTFYLWTICV